MSTTAPIVSADQPHIPVIARVPLGLFMLVTIYLFPAGIALLRRHTNEGAIFVLNLFLGWTIIGWVGSLVWACSNDKKN